MRKQEIEAWALRIVEAVTRHERLEDVAVELKSDWPEPKEAARRIAGHANAARGESILWLIGLSETKGVVTRSPVDTADWWNQIKAEFDELAPDMHDVVVPTGSGLTVVALHMETDRAPFVVKNPTGQGKIQREVPWRDGTGLRSARRSDLLRVLVPIQRIPKLDILDLAMRVQFSHHSSALLDGTRTSSRGPDAHWSLDGTLYLTCPKDAYVVFPEGRVQLTLTSEEDAAFPWEASYTSLTSGAPGPSTNIAPRLQTIHDGIGQLIVNGPGPVHISARGSLPETDGVARTVDTTASIRLELAVEGVDLPGPATAVAHLAPSPPRTTEMEWVIGRWTLSKSRLRR